MHPSYFNFSASLLDRNGRWSSGFGLALAETLKANNDTDNSKGKGLHFLLSQW